MTLDLPGIRQAVRIAAVTCIILVALNSSSKTAAEDICPIECSDADRPVVEKIWRAWKKRENALKSVKMTWDVAVDLTPQGKTGAYHVTGTSLVLDKTRYLYKFNQTQGLIAGDYYQYNNGVVTKYSKYYDQPASVVIEHRPKGESAQPMPVFACYFPLTSIGMGLELVPWRVVQTGEIDKLPIMDDLFRVGQEGHREGNVYITVTSNYGAPRYMQIDISKDQCPLIALADYIGPPGEQHQYYAFRVHEIDVSSDGVVTPKRWDTAYYGLQGVAIPPKIQYADSNTLLSIELNEERDDKQYEIPPFEIGTLVYDRREEMEERSLIVTAEGMKDAIIVVEERMAAEAQRAKAERRTELYSLVAIAVTSLLAVAACIYFLRRI